MTAPLMTLYHAPMTRSMRLVQLIDELGAGDAVRIETVDVVRADGSGRRDERNPHPDGKVPLLVHGGVQVWESIAIAQYLAESFPLAGLQVPAGHPQRGAYLAWLAWYAATVEPVVVLQMAGVDSPALRSTFRGPAEVAARLSAALQSHDYLVDDRYTVADLILASVFGWKPEFTPDDPAVRRWVERCLARPSMQRTWRRDSAGAH